MSREAVKHIKTWSERCEEHSDHQERIITERMIQERMQEEIDELRQALETEREWVGLTDEEIDECERLATIRHQRHKYSARGQLITPADGLEWHFAGAIEAKLKEKNT
jgi:tRNA C32,U32 (ribose-2'-O)-methylase TrmJ